MLINYYPIPAPHDEAKTSFTQPVPVFILHVKSYVRISRRISNYYHVPAQIGGQLKDNDVPPVMFQQRSNNVNPYFTVTELKASHPYQASICKVMLSQQLMVPCSRIHYVMYIRLVPRNPECWVLEFIIYLTSLHVQLTSVEWFGGKEDEIFNDE